MRLGRYAATLAALMTLTLPALGDTPSDPHGIAPPDGEELTQEEQVEMYREHVRQRTIEGARQRALENRGAERRVMRVAPPPGTITVNVADDSETLTGKFERWRFLRTEFPGNDVARATIVVEVDVTSLETEDEELTERLLSPAHLNAEEFPRAQATLRGPRLVPFEQFPHETLGVDLAALQEELTDEEWEAFKEKHRFEVPGRMQFMGSTQPAIAYVVVDNWDPIEAEGRLFANPLGIGMGIERENAEAAASAREKLSFSFKTTVPRETRTRMVQRTTEPEEGTEAVTEVEEADPPVGLRYRNEQQPTNP